VVLAIGAVLLFFVLSWGISFYNSQQIDSEAEQIVQVLRKAQFSSMSSDSDSAFGVYFDAGQYVFFRGDSYASRDYEEVFLTNVSFSGDVSETVFSKLQGIPSNIGNVAVSLGGKTRTININSAGRINNN